MIDSTVTRKEVVGLLVSQGILVTERRLRTLAASGIIPKPIWSGGRGQQARFVVSQMGMISNAVLSVVRGRPIPYDSKKVGDMEIGGKILGIVQENFFTIGTKPYEIRLLSDGSIVLIVNPIREATE